MVHFCQRLWNAIQPVCIKLMKALQPLTFRWSKLVRSPYIAKVVEPHATQFSSNVCNRYVALVLTLSFLAGEQGEYFSHAILSNAHAS